MKLLKIEDYENLESRKVIEYFIEISKIPRQSGNEKGIREYIEQFAIRKNLKYVKDEYENIIIYKNATRGREKEETIAFQAHTDMICEKEKGIEHDFLKDPIILYKDGDYIKAKGTTLGADNGIGVAYMLAILDSEISIPNIECIFTVQEETTMIGAIKIDEKNIKAKKIISLDNGKEGKILVSSANCNEWIGLIKASKKIVSEKNEIYKLKYEKFLGGHSGGNIGDEKRGNPIKLAMQALKDVSKIQIINISGGSKVNVIPREFEVEFCIFSNEEQNEITKILNIIKEQKEKFYEATISLEKFEKKDRKNIKAYDLIDSINIIKFINELRNGVLERDRNENVILSANLGAIKENGEGIQIGFSERCNEMKLENEYLKNLMNLIKQYNIEIIWHQTLKGVERKDNNQLLNKCQKVYYNVFGKKMEEVISQGVVEGGFFTSKIKNCEYVCIGPNCYDVHSPNERLSISSVDRIWTYIKSILKY